MKTTLLIWENIFKEVIYMTNTNTYKSNGKLWQGGQQWNEILSRVFQGAFCQIARASKLFLAMFLKNMIIMYRSSACTHPPLILRLLVNFASVVGKIGCLPDNKWCTVFPPNSFIDPPPLHYRHKHRRRGQGGCSPPKLGRNPCHWGKVSERRLGNSGRKFKAPTKFDILLRPRSQD